jgi:hypothetical protein
MFRLGDLMPGTIAEIMDAAIQRKNDLRKDDISATKRSATAQAVPF